MTATQYVAAANFGGVSSPMPMSGIPPTGPTSLMLILVGFPATGQAVTAITVTQPAGASATFAKIGQHSGGGRMLELWLGYACVGSPTNLSIAWTGAGNIMVQIIVIAADADCAILPTVATANNAGTSTSANSGTITPAVGEIVVATAVWANSSNSSARTSAGNTFVWNNERTGSATCMGMAFCSAAAAAASQLTWTITSAAWIGLIARLTMPAPAAGVPAFVYKGRDSSTQDAGDVA